MVDLVLFSIMVALITTGRALQTDQNFTWTCVPNITIQTLGSYSHWVKSERESAYFLDVHRNSTWKVHRNSWESISQLSRSISLMWKGVRSTMYKLLTNLHTLYFMNQWTFNSKTVFKIDEWISLCAPDFKQSIKRSIYFTWWILLRNLSTDIFYQLHTKKKYTIKTIFIIKWKS